MVKAKWMGDADDAASDYQRQVLKKAATANFYSGSGIRGSAQPGREENQPSGLSTRENIAAWSGRARTHSRDDQRGDAGGHPKARDGSTGRQLGNLGKPPGKGGK